MAEHTEGRRLRGVGGVALFAVLVVAVASLGAACRSGPGVETNPHGQPVHPCEKDPPDIETPRETWSPLDCVCQPVSIHFRVGEGETIVPSGTPVVNSELKVESPAYGDEFRSPLLLRGVTPAGDRWVDVGFDGDRHYRVGEPGVQTPFELTLPFEVGARAVRCVVVSSGVDKLEIPVYVMP